MLSATVFTTFLLACASTATAHMLLSSPPGLGWAGNPYVTNVDYDLVNPISGSQYPCKGYQNDASRGAGKVVAVWPAGSAQSFSLTGSAIHEGGSCQVSLSYDNGSTFRVMKSWVGNCPIAAGGPFGFTVPTSAPSGTALFGWTWFNKIGNREMYMGCAVVSITGGGSGMSSLPEPMVANIGITDCSVLENYPVMYPKPGPVLQTDGEATMAPVGTGCGGGV